MGTTETMVNTSIHRPPMSPVGDLSLKTFTPMLLNSPVGDQLPVGARRSTKREWRKTSQEPVSQSLRRPPTVKWRRIGQKVTFHIAVGVPNAWRHSGVRGRTNAAQER